MRGSGLCNRCRKPIDTGKYFVCDDCTVLVRRDLHNRPTPEHVDAPTINLEVTLHVGFLHIVESIIELSRLRNEAVDMTPEVAASKFGDPSSRVPSPVDRVAARVSCR